MAEIAFGLEVSDLYRREGLLRLDAEFARALANAARTGAASGSLG